MVKDPRTFQRNRLNHIFFPARHSPPVEWRVACGLTDYPAAVSFMEERAKQIHNGQEDEMIWLVEHPPLYTAGTSAKKTDLLIPGRFPVYSTGRGGEFTYHGPGQRVIYVMLDLKRRRQDIRAFVTALEEWGIRTLACFNIRGERREDRIGIWIRRTRKTAGQSMTHTEDKIAAIGIRLRKWISFHGIAININPSLEHYAGIVPCGISGYGVTSLADLGLSLSMEEFDKALASTFCDIFGKIR